MLSSHSDCRGIKHHPTFHKDRVEVHLQLITNQPKKPQTNNKPSKQLTEQASNQITNQPTNQSTKNTPTTDKKPKPDHLGSNALDVRTSINSLNSPPPSTPRHMGD